MKLLTLTLNILFICLMVFSCSREESFDYRLNTFYQLLDQSSRQDFQAGKLNQVVSFLDEKIQQDPSFDKRLKNIKNHEGIDFFSTTQFVAFYYHSLFLQELE